MKSKKNAVDPPSPRDTPFPSQIISSLIVDWPAATGLVGGRCAPPSSNGYPSRAGGCGLSGWDWGCGCRRLVWVWALGIARYRPSKRTGLVRQPPKGHKKPHDKRHAVKKPFGTSRNLVQFELTCRCRAEGNM